MNKASSCLIRGCESIEGTTRSGRGLCWSHYALAWRLINKGLIKGGWKALEEKGMARPRRGIVYMQGRTERSRLFWSQLYASGTLERAQGGNSAGFLPLRKKRRKYGKMRDCPECGKAVKGLRGLGIHRSRIHQLTHATLPDSPVPQRIPVTVEL